MRALARQGAVPCNKTEIPTNLLAANCVPSGFMVPKGWDGVVDYYKHAEEAERWTPWSRPRVEPNKDAQTSASGVFGTTSFSLAHVRYDSFWHDIPMRPSDDETTINLVTEISMYATAKMEVQKERQGNPIKQDVNNDGSPRYYTYGTPFFNYGLIPQTWEDPSLISVAGNGGDNDPLDVMELGGVPLQMGSITPCRVLGSFELIDEGETDHKILCIALSDPDANSIHNLDDLERVKPGHISRLVDWLKRYKTSDGKGVNSLASNIPKTVPEALAVIEETAGRWKSLCGKDGTPLSNLTSMIEGFRLDSPGCRGIM